MKRILADFLGIFYPDICIICNENLHNREKQVCLSCFSEIPRTNYHLLTDNPVEKRFWGKVQIEKATSFFFFTKGSPFQTLLHELKYHNNREIGALMGLYAGNEINQRDYFENIDLVIPIPLHPKKKRKRGYNQSEEICKGLSESLSKPTDFRNLIRTKENATQTKKSVFERYENTSGIFEVNDPTTFANKHILLVDDVLTTGSTLEAAANAILSRCSNVKISIFTLSIA